MRYKFPLYSLLFSCTFLFAQEKEKQEEALNVQQVEVTKSYTPSVSEVFKIRATPPGADTLQLPTTDLKYDFLSIPVLETFVPNKAKPLQLKRAITPPQYNSQLKFLLGNQQQMLLDGAANLAVDRQQYVGIDLLWDQKGSVPNTQLISEQAQFLINFNHDYYTNKYHAAHQIRFEGAQNNFYGIDPKANLAEAFTREAIDPLIRRSYFDAVSNWEWYDNPVQKLKLHLSLGNDNFSSSEQLVTLNSVFRVPLRKIFIDFKPQLEVVQTDFQREYYSNEALSIQQLQLGTTLQLLQLNKNFKYKIGARMQWLANPWEEGGTQLFYYPDVMLSYASNKSLIKPYLTVNGALKNASYSTLSLQNPYLAPSSQLRPEDVRYKAILGFNTQFKSGIDFGLEGFYSTSEGTPLFKRLAASSELPKTPYSFSNAYEVVFDNQTKFGAKVAMQYQMNDDNQISFELQHTTFQQTDEAAPWNLPQLEVHLNSNFKFWQRFLVISQLRHWGSRKVAYRPIFINQPPALNTPEIKNLPGLTSFNLELNYQTQTPWSFFAVANLNLGSTPQYWLEYSLFPSLFSGGFRYNFNFRL